MWRRFERWLLWGLLIAVERRCPFVSIDRLNWDMAVWIYGLYTHEWGSLTYCAKTVRCDTDLRGGTCAALRLLSNGLVCLFLSTVWTELWSIEYIDGIHMCEIASPIVPKLWNLTHIWDLMLVRLCDCCRTALSVCFYRPSRLSYEYMGNIHTSEVASPIVPKLWSVTQIWDVALVRLCDSCRTALFFCFYRPSGLSYGCLNIWVTYTRVR